MTTTNNNEFSLKALLAAGLSGLIAYKLYQVQVGIQYLEREHERSATFQFFIELLKSDSTDPERMNTKYQYLKLLLIVLLISYIVKTIGSLVNSFQSDFSFSKYVTYLLIIEVIFLLLFTGLDSFQSLIIPILVFAVPNVIIMSLLPSSDT
jgi:hypothetical protein